MQRAVTLPARHPRRNALALAGAWVAVVLLFWLGLFVPAMRPGVFRPEAVDLYGYFFPKFVYGSAELGRGALPLWNPYEYAGVPFLGAAQPAVLYPPRVLLFALLPPTAALHVFMVVHYLLLGAGAFVMLRALALEVPGACLGTLLLAFEPLMMGGHYHPPRIACFAWVPWMVAAFVRTVEGRGLGSALGLAVAAALQATAGYPEYSLDTALVLALFWPAAARRAGGARAALGGSALAVAAAALAAMLSAVQLVSLVETFRMSTRAGGQLPFLAGQRFALATFGSGLRGWAAAIGTFAYMPALAWALVFVGLAAPERPYRGALVALWVFASVAFTPALRALPPFSLFRSFLCWGSIVVLPLAALAGAGFDRLMRGRLGAREAVAGTVALAALLPLLPARSLAWLTLALAVLLGSRRAPRAAIVGLLALTLADVWTFVPAPLPATLRHRYAEGQVPYPSLDAELRRANALRAACGAGSGGRILAPPETLAGVPVAGRLRAAQGYPESLPPARMSRLLEAAGLAPAMLLALDWERLARAHGLLGLLDVSCLVVEPGHERQLADLGLAPGGQLADGRTAYVRRPEGTAFVVGRPRPGVRAATDGRPRRNGRALRAGRLCRRRLRAGRGRDRRCRTGARALPHDGADGEPPGRVREPRARLAGARRRAPRARAARRLCAHGRARRAGCARGGAVVPSARLRARRRSLVARCGAHRGGRTPMSRAISHPLTPRVHDRGGRARGPGSTKPKERAQAGRVPMAAARWKAAIAVSGSNRGPQIARPCARKKCST